jgi:periplasmic divalent cation tolerance protein
MDKYIVITTLCDKEEIAIDIYDKLLNKKLIAGCQISLVDSKYWWNGELEEAKEYHLEMRSKKSLYSEIEQEIKKIHDYDVFEISYYEIQDGNKAFLDWIDESVSRKK